MSDEPREKQLDYPFAEVCATAQEAIAHGGTVFQKFTCEYCGVRQFITEPNAFYRQGTCEKCGKVTDIQARGCNYMVVFTRT